MEKAGAGALLACIPALILGRLWVICRGFTGGSDRFADLAFLEFDAPVVVAVGGPEHDSPPGRGSWEPLLYGLHQMQMRNKSAGASWEA